MNNEAIVKALKSSAVRSGIAAVIQSTVQEHISASRGRKGRLKPLKPLFGKWKDKKGVEHVQAGYRNGGQPLRDTGRLQRSIRAKVMVTEEGMQAVIVGEPYGKGHESGFQTKGPNYIPLTQAGRRGDVARYKAYLARAIRKAERLEDKQDYVPRPFKGLVRGKDYFIAWNGVKVPARPYMQPTREDMRKIGKSIVLGLRAALGGH